MSLDTTTSCLIVVGLVLATFLIVILGLLFLLLTTIRTRLHNEEEPSSYASRRCSPPRKRSDLAHNVTGVATRYINKPLPRVPHGGSPFVSTFRKKRHSQPGWPLMADDDNRRGYANFSP